MFKRLLAYINLGIFLLTVLGYYGIMSGMKELSGKRMAKRLDSGMYDLGGNITIKVPLALPYEVTSGHFEKETGQFEMDGEIFRIIKQRHHNDTLYVVCIRDDQTSRISSALKEFAKTFTGQEDGKEKQSVPALIKDYTREDIGLTRMVIGWEEDLQLSTRAHFLFPSYFASIIHPPERSIAQSMR